LETTRELISLCSPVFRLGSLGGNIEWVRTPELADPSPFSTLPTKLPSTDSCK